MSVIGYWALVLTLIISAYTAVASLLAARHKSAALLQSVRNGVFLATAGATLASAALLYLLLTRDLSIAYVSEHVSTHLPTAYVISAFWAGQQGSLLLWLWVLTLMALVLILPRRSWEAPFSPYALATASGAQAGLAVVLLLVSNPFQSLPIVPLEGQGLNPLLQNVWMIIHPPVVFIGYAAYTIPFALALGGLASGELGQGWLRAVRRWALFAWLFLGAGILMGAWWAYLELGWGGYWGWDPVENSSLIPWLTGTALLHSLMMQQRRRAFKAWNLWLITATFLLCVFATFVTRSGIIQSVHAFERSSIGYYFMAFMLLCLLAFVALLYARRRELESTHELRTWFSREAGLFLTNLLLLGTALVVLVGTLFPALVELVQGRQAALDASFYERTVGPLAQVIIVLIGVCPWLAWGGVSSSRLRRELLPAAVAAVVTAGLLFALGVREPLALVAFAICAFVGVSLLATFYRDTANRHRSAEESYPIAFLKLLGRNRRRYGAHVVHLGIVLIAVGITGSSIYQDEVEVALAPGETVDVHGYTLHYQDLLSQQMPDQQRFTAVVDAYRGSRQIAALRPQKDYHWNIEQWVTEVAIHSTPKEDLYVILAGFESDGLASFRVLINPLVVWLWIGGGALLLGGIMAWWPTAAERSRS
jgi:cytochrome c-type biogenesis protein CcmF